MAPSEARAKVDGTQTASRTRFHAASLHLSPKTSGGKSRSGHQFETKQGGMVASCAPYPAMRHNTGAPTLRRQRQAAATRRSAQSLTAMAPFWLHHPNKTHGGPLIAALAVMASLQWSSANAETLIYKSVDPEGRISYGDKPAAGAVAVQEIRLTPTSAGADATSSQERIKQWAETTERLREDRAARESQRAAARPPPQGSVPLFGPEESRLGVRRDSYYYQPGLLQYPQTPFHFDRRTHPTHWHQPQEWHRPYPRAPRQERRNQPLPRRAIQ